MADEFDDLLEPSAFALSQKCQVAVGTVLSIPDWSWPELDSITALFAKVLPPSTYRDALHSAALLHRFVERAAVEIHIRLHGGAISPACPFNAMRHACVSFPDQAHPESWSAAAIFATWSAAYLRGLSLYHRGSIADRAIRRLRAGVGVGVRAPDLAREIGCSVPVLYRKFRQATGMSPRQFQIQMRVDRATELLQQTDWKADAIAREVGWKSKKDLHVALQRVGTTPAIVRRLAAGGADDPPHEDDERP